MGMLLGSRIATGPSGLARSPYRVPSPPRARVGFGSWSWWWFENWRVDASKNSLFLFTVFSDELYC